MVLVTLGIVIALAAAVRSTWSPCGLSMLSQITPVAEMGRHQRFGRTAAWFIVGSVIGGLTLGGLIAVGAAGAAAAGLSDSAALTLIAVAAIGAAAVDAHVFGFGPPFLRRQVNEDWLSNYRSWVYGGGFGWQIGAGITTYVMTAAVPLMIIAGALSARPWAGVAMGAGFGLVRGLAVLSGARLRTTTALYAFHRRFAAWADPVRQAVIAVQLAVATVATWIVAPVVVAACLTLAVVVTYARTRTCAPRAPTSPPPVGSLPRDPGDGRPGPTAGRTAQLALADSPWPLCKPLWNLFDLIPEGRGIDWDEQLDSSSCDDGTST